MVRMLLDEKVQFRFPDLKYGPFVLASALKGGKDTVEFALNQRFASGTQKFAIQPDSLKAERAIYEAVRHADTSVLVLLLDQGIMSKEALSRHGSALLYESTSAPNINVTKNVIDILLARGVDIDARGKFGWTFLLEAIRNVKHEVVPFLLGRGANPVSRDNNSCPYPLVAAATKNSFKIAKYLLETIDKQSIPLKHWKPQWNLVEKTANSEEWKENTKLTLEHYHYRQKYPLSGKPSSSNSGAKGSKRKQSSRNGESTKSTKCLKKSKSSKKGSGSKEVNEKRAGSMRYRLRPSTAIS